MTALSSTTTPGPNTTFGSTVTSRPNLVSATEIDGFGRDHGDARFHRGATQAPLHHILGLRELCLVVDAQDLVLRGFERDQFERHAVRDGHGVGQVEFALGVLVVDAPEDIERDLAAQRHQSAVAQIDLAFDVARVALFADCDQPVTVHHQPPVSRWIVRAKTKHRDTRMMIDRAAQAFQRLRADQRRIAVDHQNIVRALFDRGARAQYRMGGAAPLGLNEGLRLGQHPLRFVGDCIRVGADHDRRHFGTGAADRRQHMRQHRTPGHLMQHLRPRRAHAGAFASGENDCQTRSLAHRRPWGSSRRHTQPRLSRKGA